MQPNSEYATFRAGLLLSGWIAASVTLEHQGEKLDLRAYVKEIDDGFGIGQQSAAEKGVRKIGVDGRAQISEQFFFDGEASWQQNLETDAIRNTARAQIRYENNGLTAATGLVHASDEFSGYTDLIGVDFRRGFKNKWDWGAHTSVYHSYESKVIDYGFGLDVGFNVRDNMWVTVGYNIAGFHDKDFTSARYTAEGPYLQVSIKADQHALRNIAGQR